MEPKPLKKKICSCFVSFLAGLPGKHTFCKTAESKGKALAAMVLLLAFTHGVTAQDLDVPYVPTPNNVVEKMLDIANVGPGDYVIDLGSGDGRIVIAAAKRGAFGHGVDIDPRRVEEGEDNALKEGVANRVMFLEENIFETDFSRANVITMYLLSSVNLKLRPDLLENLDPGTRVVSHDFNMGDWEADIHVRVDNRDIYYWVIPADVEGNWSWNSGGNNFSMSIKQEFQEITAKSGNRNLKIENSVLSGERISFTAVNTSNGHNYVYSGKVEGDTINGTVQIRRENSRSVENWRATSGK